MHNWPHHTLSFFYMNVFSPVTTRWRAVAWYFLWECSLLRAARGIHSGHRGNLGKPIQEGVPWDSDAAKPKGHAAPPHKWYFSRMLLSPSNHGISGRAVAQGACLAFVKMSHEIIRHLFWIWYSRKLIKILYLSLTHSLTLSLTLALTPSHTHTHTLSLSSGQDCAALLPSPLQLNGIHEH